ncbi:hypothetical protein L6272_01695, partial [Microgenomates group bacterium]|nr:hypothetical protein [Microgenomates group bacterium]
MAGLTRAGAVELDRMDQTHLENIWHDTVEPFRVIGDAWKNDRQQFTQETLRAINLAFNPVLADEHGKRYFNGRSVIYWTGLGMLTWGAISACDYIWNRQPDGIPGPGGDSNPTPESLCNSLVQIAAVNSVDVAVSAPEWQAAGIDKSQLQQDIDCFAPDGGILSVAEVIKFGPNPGDIIAQLAWSKGGEVIPLLAVPGAQVDDLQLVQFLDPKTSQWEALGPDQAQAQLAAVNINSITGDIEPENNGAVVTATRDFNQNISFQIVNPDG